MSQKNGKIGRSEFAALMKPCLAGERPAHVAVAVSGGADSMAMALLADRWCRARKGVRLTAITVDHQLRPGSGAEARRVKAWMRARDIDHRILRWTDPKPKANVQAQARAARYRLMDAWCFKHGASHLLLAHHLEDQAETLLMRLSRGSGVYGLAAMAARKDPPFPGGPVRLRPCLYVPKERLRETLKANHQYWIEDPSNENEAYLRVQTRRVWPALARLNITPERVAATTKTLQRARAALDSASDRLIETAVTLSPAGQAAVALDALLGVPEEVGLRTLGRLAAAVGGQEFAPRLVRLERLWEALQAEAAGKAPAGNHTLSHCLIKTSEAGGVQTLRLWRESRDVGPPVLLRAGAPVIWDGRFCITTGRGAARAITAHSFQIDRLGAEGWSAAIKGLGGKKPRDIPYGVGINLPALRAGKRLVSVPHLGLKTKGKAPVITIESLTEWRLMAASRLCVKG